jgi:hypothetical protein
VCERDVTARVNYYISLWISSQMQQNFIRKWHVEHNGIYCIVLAHTEQKLRAFKIFDIYAWVHYTYNCT